jgi:3-dehydroquinate synthase
MVMAAELSQRLGLIDVALVARLRRLVERAGLPTVGPALDATDNAGRYMALMQVDKKAEAGAIKFVVIDRPGSAAVRGAPEALVRDVIDACCAPV